MNERDVSRRSLLTGLASVGLAGAVPHAASSWQVSSESRIAPLARRKGIPFGTAIDAGDLAHDDLTRLYKAHCTSLTPRNAMKWTATEKRRGKFNFDSADRIVAFAQSNGMQVYGHTLVWHNVPGSIASIDNPKHMASVMHRHITAQVRHFAGKVAAWDVVNEPLEYDSDKLRPSPFMKLLGEGYIAAALKTARLSDPSAMLLINETHLEKAGKQFDEKRQSFLALVDRTMAAGAPLDAIGIQGHFRPGLDRLDEQAFGKFCRDLKDRGLGVYITELDASCRFTTRIKGFSDEVFGKVFERTILAAASNGNLKGVTVWGMAERHAVPVKREVTPTCAKRVNLYDGNDLPRSTLASIIRAYEAMPDA